MGKTTSLVELIKAGDKALEKAVDELLIVYTQPQSAYMEMASVVPLVKMVRLVGKLDLETFEKLIGDNIKATRGIIFDDVCLAVDGRR